MYQLQIRPYGSHYTITELSVEEVEKMAGTDASSITHSNANQGLGSYDKWLGDIGSLSQEILETKVCALYFPSKEMAEETISLLNAHMLKATGENNTYVEVQEFV